MMRRNGLNKSDKNRVRRMIEEKPSISSDHLARIMGCELQVIENYRIQLAKNDEVVIKKPEDPVTELPETDTIGDDLGQEIDLPEPEAKNFTQQEEDEHGPLPGTEGWNELSKQQKGALTKARNKVAAA